LSDGERHDEWHRISDGRADVVIGARSAVFAPVANLGIIIVDEEHEHTYKQDEAPRYNARDVAVMRGKLEGCAVVLGSATPSLESWNNARSGKFILAELPNRVDNRRMPHMRIVDMRIGAKGDRKGGIFSQDLIEAIGDRLERKEQVMLFLNRRGHSTSIVCPSCGFTEKCDDCSVTLTYHRTEEKLLCHVCGKVTKTPQKCRKCSADSVKYSGVGTQKVEEVTRKIFPKANVARLDSDTTTRKDSYEDVLGRFRTGKIDILIGTQMIAKGLHFPNVTLVGVIYADMSLNIPDFRASERTFQLIAQVAGRAGRGDVPGEVIVQTYTPFHQAVQAARRLDYAGFCEQELEYRKELLYPPFAHLFVLTFKGRSHDKTAAFAGFYSKKLTAALDGKAMVSEAVEAPLSKMKGQYRQQVIIRAKSAKSVRECFRTLVSSIKPSREISCVIDVDALNIM
jgi:primosomal protein N' (replication factor Y) (superfamily II helicase)